MADALVSPAVGGTMWAASAGLLAYCARRIKRTLDDRLIPLMGVLGAFVFAAMMINFSIPLTGSSGHLGGGLLLAILLGPYAAFVTIASVLAVQALFFADGGLLALGCNIFNLGFFPAFIAYPLVYQPLVRGQPGNARLWVGSILAAVVGLQLGAFGVVLETTLSGISDLPFRAFVLLMQPIHLAIGVVEGLATAAVVAFVRRARPEALLEPLSMRVGVDSRAEAQRRRGEKLLIPARGETGGLRRVVVGLLVAAVVIAGGVSWFASTHPDGLEWAIARTRGIQTPAAPTPAPWPAVSAVTSVAGLVGGAITLALAGLAGLMLKCRRR